MPRPTYPVAKRVGVVEVVHGHRVADPYRWLEDADSDDTERWSSAQDALFSAERATWQEWSRLRERLAALADVGFVSVPLWRADRQFFLRQGIDQEHAVLVTVDGDEPDAAAERVLIDPADIDPSGTTTLDSVHPSNEGDLLAYLLSERGTEESVLRVMDTATGAVVDGPIDRARFSPVAWLPGGGAYYYVRRLDPAQVPAGEERFHRRVWLHRVGTDPEQDVMIFGEGLDKTSRYDISASRDGRWLTVSVSAGAAPGNDLWLADLRASRPEQPALRVVQQGSDASTSAKVGQDGRLYIFTDRDAPRGRLCVASPQNPSCRSWRDLVPEDPEAVLNGYVILDGPELGDRPVLLCAWMRHAVGEITVHDLRTGRRIGEVPLPGLGSIDGLSERPEGGHQAWFGYTDHTTPSHVLQYDARTGHTPLWAAAPGVVDRPDIRTRHVTYESRDGTPVRMLVISPHDPGQTRQPRPTILYGYGGFGVPLTPTYSAVTLTWVEAGGVYVVANVRGGGEEGEDWHRAGMGPRKQNTFDDLHCAAEWLVGHGYTTPNQLAIWGSSNGGLLVGAALTQRPDLYAAAVCSAPLLDMVRYETSGLGAAWTAEYGDPADAEQIRWLLAYSPYHHVRDGLDYPATLFATFNSDTRVDPLHARKMCAALQNATSGERPILVRRESDVGHGARAVSRAVDVTADALAFVARWTGMSHHDTP